MNDLASVLIELGNEAQAVTLLQQAIPVACRRQYTARLRVILSNCGAALSNLNRFWEANRYYKFAHEVANVDGDRDGIAMIHLRFFQFFVDVGHWTEAARAYKAFTDCPPIWQRRWWEVEAARTYAEMLIHQERDAGDAIDRAWQFAEGEKDAYRRAIIELRAEYALQQRKPDEAIELFSTCMGLAYGTGAQVGAALANLARANALASHKEEASRLIDEALLHDAPHVASAEVFLTIGERERAKYYAIEAYKASYAEGPLYSKWWDLRRAQRVLADLRISRPRMVGFRATPRQTVPDEELLRAYIAQLDKRGYDHGSPDHRQ